MNEIPLATCTSFTLIRYFAGSYALKLMLVAVEALHDEYVNKNDIHAQFNGTLKRFMLQYFIKRFSEVTALNGTML